MQARKLILPNKKLITPRERHFELVRGGMPPNPTSPQQIFSRVMESPREAPLSSGPGPAFSPTDYADLALWYDASDLATITKDGSDFVSQWDDKSGNDNHAVQGTMASQLVYNATGLNGLPTMTSSAVPQYMSLTSPVAFTRFTIWMVLYSDTAASAGGGRQAIFGNTATAEGVEVSPQFAYQVFSGSGGSGKDAATYPINTPVVLEFWSGNATSECQFVINGTNLGNDGNDGVWNMNVNILGARAAALWSVLGGYSDVLLYTRAQPDEERVQMRSYLNTKWSF